MSAANRRSSPISLPNSAALSRFRRVVLTAGVIAYANAYQRGLGVLERTVQTTDAVAPVQIPTDPRTKIMVASGVIAANTRVYADAAGKVAQTGSVFEGYALTATTADGDEVEVLQIMDPHEKLFTQTTASSAVTNTTTATAFDQSFTIPANTLQAGDVIRVRAGVVATATNSTDTLAVTLKIGSTTVCATAAVDVANSDVAWIDVDLVIRTSGANGTLVAAGTANIKTTATGVLLASTAIDTTADQAVTVLATWSVANTGNSCRLDVLDITRIAA